MAPDMRLATRADKAAHLRRPVILPCATAGTGPLPPHESHTNLLRISRDLRDALRYGFRGRTSGAGLGCNQIVGFPRPQSALLVAAQAVLSCVSPAIPSRTACQ